MEVSIGRLVSLSLLSSLVAFGQGPSQSAMEIARRFLPPGTELAKDYRYDYSADKVAASWPAVFEAHILTPTSRDIVFAYYSPQIHVIEKTLFLDVLHPVGEDYEKVYEVSYRSQLLLSPLAMRLIHLNGSATDAVAVFVGVGASLGGHLDVFLWQDPWGWQNIFPATGGVHYCYFFPADDTFKIALSAARNLGAGGVPPPKPPASWFKWDGAKFVSVPAPPATTHK